MKIKFKKSDRGFVYGEFTDYYGKSCSIQDSSLAYPDAIWLGTDGDGNNSAPRMHLTRKQTKKLIKVLQYFVDHGCLPDVKDE